jgi:hypothetical protein
MHDLLEGIIPFEMALVLKALMSKGYFDLDPLNRVISRFSYDPLDKADKPVQIGAMVGDIVKQNAGRTWTLLRLLSIMIESKIPSTDLHWQFLLELKDIVEVCFAFKVSVGHVIDLQIKVQNHLQTFKELFPDRRFKPKHHFLLDYPHCFLLYGPLRSCWCMWFESNHYYFTHLMRTVNNYKNVCFTLQTGISRNRHITFNLAMAF